MKKALVDISVLLIFFARPDTFIEVFEQVKKARPSRLFLYQDGPRQGRKDDIENIAKCREIAEDIDWECEVHRLYQDKNIGVDPSGYIADIWAFSMTDKCIVLEDDVVPCVSFFAFCKRMLDKYEEDERVMLISGFNVEEITSEIIGDYFFTCTTFTWGWATWKRVIDSWDPTYAFLNETQKVKCFQDYIRQKKIVKNTLNICRAHLNSEKEHFETILASNQYLRHGLTIVPRKNMVNNIGITGNSAHYVNDIRLVAKGLRTLFTMNRYEMDVEHLDDPTKIEDYTPYLARAYRIYGWGHPFVKIFRVFETTMYRIKGGNVKEALADVKQKFGKFLKGISS